MKRSQSVCYLCSRLRRFLYELVERVAQNLREYDVHSHSGANNCFKGSAFNPSGSEAYLQTAVDISRINEEVGAGYGDRVILSDCPTVGSYAKRLAATQTSFPLRHLVSHNQILPSQNYLNKVIRPVSGVQS